MLAWTGLGSAADRRIDTYSKGMLQRLGLAQAVVHEPQVVLLDEPTSGLDPEGRQAVVRLIRELKAQGRTVVLTAHLLAQADAMCDRLALLGQGRLLATGPTTKCRLSGVGRATARTVWRSAFSSTAAGSRTVTSSRLALPCTSRRLAAPPRDLTTPSSAGF